MIIMILMILMIIIGILIINPITATNDFMLSLLV